MRAREKREGEKGDVLGDRRRATEKLMPMREPAARKKRKRRPLPPPPHGVTAEMACLPGEHLPVVKATTGRECRSDAFRSVITLGVGADDRSITEPQPGAEWINIQVYTITNQLVRNSHYLKPLDCSE